MEINLTVNGVQKTVEIKAGETLLDLLRRNGYKSVKRGCNEGHCGSCTVLIDGKAHNRKITTIEGIGTSEKPHPLQKHFVEKGAVQCGFCIPGMILSAKALLEENPSPSEEEIKEGLDGNWCRCTGYVKQVEAVQAAALEMRGGK
jgi:putative selenate reductase molybdopterin-binding subunit